MTDERHERRIRLMQTLFAHTFIEETSQADPDAELAAEVELIVTDLPQIDAQIHRFALERPLSEINKVDLAVLRLIVYESQHKKTPKKVLIDEAVELAKEFGSETSPKFVNGVLGQLLMTELDAEPDPESESASSEALGEQKDTGATT